MPVLSVSCLFVGMLLSRCAALQKVQAVLRRCKWRRQHDWRCSHLRFVARAGPSTLAATRTRPWMLRRRQTQPRRGAMPLAAPLCCARCLRPASAYPKDCGLDTCCRVFSSCRAYCKHFVLLHLHQGWFAPCAPLVLIECLGSECRCGLAATAACNVYNNVTGNIAPGSVQIGVSCCLHSGKSYKRTAAAGLTRISGCDEIVLLDCGLQPCILHSLHMARWVISLFRSMQMALRVFAGPVNGTGTQLSVAWNASARTATIVFKGSTTREDWITVRKCCAATCIVHHPCWQCLPVRPGA